ncbi:glycogen debranching protein GlgX [Agromyces sp. ISL-38]|uniref:glycogen debranching protein GlgX n=1 Tax=Agromyces sp. ISL-38 TaxID=2819107 RepID=UPI001BE63E60|nr:glycogen debranching protein GlgX [Agromyces sp. ISL-38]MBT2499758.1 glycogen debranching protein GlgX [Agromyces sp. ISL-38]MBT2516094.1 glycogen debranching protein GlgX [Streptomyces sp. ISL-90]
MSAPDPLRDLGVQADADGGRIRIWSENATSVDLVIFDPNDLEWATDRVALERDEHGVWHGASEALVPGARYGLRVDGPAGPPHAFNPVHTLLDPYARGLSPAADGSWRGAVLGNHLDWGDSAKPRVPLDHTVVYETHVRGFSRLNPAIPEELRGTYAGLAHDSSLEYLTNLGVTTVELLPVHAFVPEQRLIRQGKTNYWGYNTLAFFAPHAPYASASAQVAGPGAVRREFAGMVKRLHEAGLEVVLDVVYNHTAEEGREGPVFSFRGIDNGSYYRHDAHGRYVDTTGCGNTLDFGREAPVRLALDSMRYFAEELQVDGFRLDLAATLARDDHGGFTPEHPLLRGMLEDPVISTTKLIAEPWDVGPGGWQTGNFPAGFTEWNDRYRDRMRDFWLGDLRRERETGTAGSGIGRFATRLAGSANTFSTERGPLASLNFITAHDGFTLADLTSYDVKHNLGNGEHNRDGTDGNNSYNHGVEGDTADRAIRAARRRSIRNLLATLLLSAGVPMLTAGDEFGRSQRGNNNAYCHDSELTWLAWDAAGRPRSAPDLLATTRRLIRLRAENPALRPVRFGRFGESTPSASQMDWFNADGTTMTIDDWNSPEERTLQYLAASTPEFEAFNRILLVVHAHESDVEVVLAEHAGVSGYTLLWDSADETPTDAAIDHEPGDRITMTGPSMRLFRAHASE